MDGARKALPLGRAFFMYLLVAGMIMTPGRLVAAEATEMTEAEAVRLGEQFGIVVGPVDEEIQKELKMQKPEGVVVFEVIGGTPADLAGIKVRAVIKEIDKVEVRTMLDFGRALKRALPTENFTVGTYEPADPEVQGVGGLINFHFVRIVKD
jgi:membrane-associated protease RseP (regulator of RpoE activity)